MSSWIQVPSARCSSHARITASKSVSTVICHAASRSVRRRRRGDVHGVERQDGAGVGTPPQHGLRLVVEREDAVPVGVQDERGVEASADRDDVVARRPRSFER